MTPQYMVLSSASVAFLACLVLPFLPNHKKSIGGCVFVLLNAAITSVPAWQALVGQSVEFTVYGGIVFGDIPMRIDPLSAWFMLIVNLTCVNGALYGIDYIKPDKEQRANLSLHWIAFVVFHTSMLGVCTFQQGLAFLVAWEIMTVSSLILVMFDHSRIKILGRDKLPCADAHRCSLSHDCVYMDLDSRDHMTFLSYLPFLANQMHYGCICSSSLVLASRQDLFHYTVGCHMRIPQLRPIYPE